MENELDIYRQQGFANRMGLGQAPAVLIIDFVVGFTDPAHFGGGNIGAAITGTRQLLTLARVRGWPVAHTRVVYADDGSDVSAFTMKVPALLKLTETSPLSQFVPELTPAPGEAVFRKKHASAFFGTDLVAWLAFRRIDTLLVAGCTTSGCVRASVIDASAHNVRPIVITDCVGDRAVGPHEANLFDMGQKYADLLSMDELRAAVGSNAPAG
ncbi:MAG: maleamate amidohydrolase [Acetobacteraceae bacterium]|nr:maleamate amidohydrolase [Acetobacteraceae bacterium]